MKLVDLEVRHFGCVEHAAVSFGGGLNVLYGPNDLGKSTLARAIRAALLIPTNSAPASELWAWTGAENPSVKLTFQADDGRTYRITKHFGDRGSALLEESKDGSVFHGERRARDVDGRVRELLAWGVRAPGGQGAPRGVPASFLSTVLLGQQADVKAIFEQALSADTDESGKLRLTQALRAFAEDPVFKRVLGEAQAQVDRSFTQTGRPKTGRGAPLFAASQAVEGARKELEALRETAEAALHAEEAARRLLERSATLREERDLAAAEAERLTTLAARARERRALEGELEAAKGQLTRSLHTVETAAERRAVITATEKALAANAVRLHAARATQEARAATLSRAQEAQRLLREAAARERALARSELQARRADCAARGADARAHLERAAAALGRMAAADEAQAALDALDGRRAALEREEGEAQAGVGKLREMRDLFELAAQAGQLATLQAEVASLEQVRRDLEVERAALAERRAEAARRDAEARAGLPSREALQLMHQAQQGLEVAEARLGGGLSLRLDLLAPLALEARVDGAKRRLAAKGTVELEAERSIQLQLGQLGSLELDAGRRDARVAAEAARRRHAEVVRGPLAALGLEDLAALERALSANERALSEAAELRRAASERERLLDEREKQLERLPASLADRADRAAQLEPLPVYPRARRAWEQRGAEVTQALPQVRQQLDAAAAASHALASARAALQAERAALAERERTLREEARRGEPEGGWATAQEAAQTAASGALAEDAGLAERERELQSGETPHEAAAQRELDDASEGLGAAEREADAAEAEHLELRERREHAAGELAALERQLGEVRLSDEEAAVRALEARGALLAEGGEPVSDEVLRDAMTRRDAADEALRAHATELQRAQLALELTGGAVVKERVEQARETLVMARRREAELEVDAKAWKLLVESLREAEASDTLHLGEALSGPVTAAFAALTQGRYGKVELGPDLRADGILAAGRARALGALSAGTQEQLATLLRLTVAESLRSALVLDDQLTQTDPERASWFRRMLRERAAVVQVVVLTCRPGDYLDGEELPSAGEATRERAAGMVRAVDLARVLTRG